MSEIFRAPNVDAAIDLASQFHKEQRYDLFRGQTRAEWLPYSSLRRLRPDGEGELDPVHQARIFRFLQWLQNTPGLVKISKDPHVAFAIAQHYGIPTNYLDFTTDPAVAGFFAADTSAPIAGMESCIFCLNSADLLWFWNAHEEVLDFPELAIIRPEVENLWRLQAQSGAFLYTSANWVMHYPMDKIVFPFSGYPSYPTRRDIYPDRKSQLEILLDQFFDHESKLNEYERTQDFIAAMKASGVPVRIVDVGRSAGYEKLASHHSWDRAEAWQTLTVETHREVWRRIIPIALDMNEVPTEIATKFGQGVRRAIERDSLLRRHAIVWEVEQQDGIACRPTLAAGLASLWDGLRCLPCQDVELAQALGNWAALHQLKFDCTTLGDEQLDSFSRLMGPSMRIEFGAADGSSSTGFAAKAGLVAAFRDDLHQVLSAEHLKFADDPWFLLQILTSPRKLFDFDRLCHLFVTQIAPSQQIRPPPHFYHPARLSVLGLP
jgi:hypothetical protein